MFLRRGSRDQHSAILPVARMPQRKVNVIVQTELAHEDNEIKEVYRNQENEGTWAAVRTDRGDPFSKNREERFVGHAGHDFITPNFQPTD